jgi:hypothetical protein
MAWVNYTNTGPFTNNSSPGISATFLNNIESFLDQFAGSLVTDSHLSVDGNGKLTVLKIQLPTGSLTRIAQFSGTGGGTFSHGLGATPNIVFVQYAGNFGTAPSQATAYYNTTSTQVTIAAQSGYSWQALAIAF